MLTTVVKYRIRRNRLKRAVPKQKRWALILNDLQSNPQLNSQSLLSSKHLLAVVPIDLQNETVESAEQKYQAHLKSAAIARDKARVERMLIHRRHSKTKYQISLTAVELGIQFQDDEEEDQDGGPELWSSDTFN